MQFHRLSFYEIHDLAIILSTITFLSSHNARITDALTAHLLLEYPLREFIQLGLAYLGIGRHFFPEIVQCNAVANRVLYASNRIAASPKSIANILKRSAFFVLIDFVAL